VQVDANVWSLTELHNVINQLKKELADARAKAKL
jgi:ribosomal protein L29